MTDTLFEYYNTGKDSVTNFHTQNVAQTFTTGSIPHTITSVKLELESNTTESFSMTILIKATDGNGKPTGATLTSGSLSGTLTITPTWFEIIITPYSLTPNTKYAIIAYASVGNAARWDTDLTSPSYTGGSWMTSNDGITWTVADYDLMFEVYGIESQIVGVVAGGKLINQSATNKLETANSNGLCKYYTSAPASGYSATRRVNYNGKLIDA